MKKKIVAILIIAFVLCASFAINEYVLVYPKYFPSPTYNFKNNTLNSKIIALGRKLFYDPILSADNTISCASCHSPYNAFAHTDHEVSHGIQDKMGTRNAPALFNLAWQNAFMWDGAATILDEQAIIPITHPLEMGESMPVVINKLKSSAAYKAIFFDAFMDSAINVSKIVKALAQFQLTLISANAKYDSVKLGKSTFTLQEKNGYNLFIKNCNVCHTEPLFSNYTFANNGLKVDTTLNDFGRWQVTKKSEDSLQFKIPSLRNLSYTFPYMHDGRFNKLSEVIQHYTHNIQQQKNVSIYLKKRMALTPNQKVDLIAFLLTLNDKAFVFNANFQFPK
jgi:cytochrome c peroxidase